MWILAAALSAITDGLSTIFDKSGLRHCDAMLANAVRNSITLLMSLIMVFIVGSYTTISTIPINDMFFLFFSGFCTAISCLCYYKALVLGNVNKVVPIYKSSAVISVLIAIFMFGESNNLPIKLLATILLGVGIFVMIDNKQTLPATSKKWFIYALLSALLAGLVYNLAKVGMANVESNLGVTIRNMVVMMISWAVVFEQGKMKDIKYIHGHEWLCLTLSGILFGLSNIFFYYAIKFGEVSVVVPIDKMSTLVAVIVAFLIYKETMSKRGLIGLGLMMAGTIIIAVCG
jgi:transporter family protein